VAVVLLTALSLMYLLSYQRVQQIEKDSEELRRERDLLREQLLSRRQEAFESKEKQFLARLRGGRSTPVDRDLAEPVSYSEDPYVPPIRVASLTTRVNGMTVEVSFRMENQGDADDNRGGFLFAIFEKDDRTPTQFLPTPAVNTNEEGFPQTYKSGIRFTRIRGTATFRRKVRRQSEQEYFTHVTLFLFTVRGGLLLKERFELDKELFLGEQPAVKTQLVTNA
jgi:hypothetical protein